MVSGHGGGPELMGRAQVMLIRGTHPSVKPRDVWLARLRQPRHRPREVRSRVPLPAPFLGNRP